MASYTHTVEVENIPLNEISGNHSSSSDDEHSHVNLRRARTDVHLRERHNRESTKYHSYSGRERRVQYMLPSQHGGELLSSHTLHYGSEHRQSAWFNTVMARRRRGVSPNTEDEAVEELADAMEGDEKLMSENVDGEIMRREVLRELYKPLRVKKEIRRRLTARRSSHRYSSRTISRMQYLKYTLSMRWYKIRQSVLDTFHDYSLWHKEIKEIEGTFGTGVGSYFKFLRYLFLLNLTIVIIVCGFLLTPQLLARLHDDTSMPHTTTDVPVTTGATPLGFSFKNVSGKPGTVRVVSNSPATTSVAGTRRPTSLSTTTKKVIPSIENDDTTKVFGPLDWLTGAGWFESTELYYGTYRSDSFSLMKDVHYNISRAYFFVIFLAYVIYLIVILHRVIVLYKNNYIDVEHDMSASFVKKVFSSWDFSITEKKAATIKHRSIYNELKELLQEFLSEEQEEGWLRQLAGWCIKLLFWAIVLVSLGLLGWAMYAMLKSGIDKDIITKTDSSGFGPLVYPLIVTCIIIIVPWVFGIIVKVEGYRIPRHRLYVTLIRTILLELTVLGVLVGFWYMHAVDPNSTTHTDDSNTNKGIGDFKILSESLQEADYCWETSLGEEFYRLLIIDFFVVVIMQLATLIFFVATQKQITKGKIHHYLLEFDISRNTLHLIYNQTLLWAGLFFCPLTPVIVLLKITIMFYIQKFSVLKFLQPDERPWRAAQTETVFFALTLVSLILSFLGYGFIIFRGNASSSCGPFQGCHHYIDCLWNAANNNEKKVLNIFSWILKPGVVAGILGILFILVYCAKSIAEGRAEMIKVLRRQLELEVRDKAFLLQLTDKVRRGEYRPASPAHIRAASPPRSSPAAPQDLTQRSSFVFTDNKVHPVHVEPEPRHFSDYTEESHV
ncbi:transmembrane channel-like protein 7 isoform X2 [Cherax quadricarinatus]|uniref:transmembrane channel-like protein 7 isoform X2 n=1 Tax=Cherax quadricarinatus TaxID=27406 RepID=UPI002378802E|nr:transmembrane channel-like protein 5 isoform X2 [Cherax quadricarinatus]